MHDLWHITLVLAATTLLLAFSHASVAQSVDVFGDPLPRGALARLGTVRLRHSSICGVSFAPDGKTVATAGDDNHIRIWNTSTGKQIREHQGHGLCFRNVSYSPDGTLLLAAGGSADSRLYIWDTFTGNELHVIKGVDLHAIAISANSQRVAWVCLNGSLGIWERPTNEIHTERLLPGGELASVAFSPEGTRIFTIGRDHLGVFDAIAKKRLAVWKNPGGEAVRCSPDGKYLAVGGALDKPLFVLDSDSGKIVHKLSAGRLLWAFEFTGDSKTLICEGDHSLVSWDVATGLPIDMIPIGSRRFVSQIAISTDARYLAVASKSSSLLILDRTTRQSHFLHDAHQGHVGWARFLNGGEEVVSAGNDGTLRIWDAKTGRCRRSIEIDPWTTSLALSPDQKIITWSGGARDYSIRLQDMQTGELIRRLSPLGIPRHLAFSPNGKHLAATDGDVRLRISDAATGKTIKTIKGEATWGAHVSYLPTPDRILAGDQGEIKVVDAKTGKTIKKIEAPNRGIVVAPNGKEFAAIPQLDEDPIRIFDIETGKIVKEFADELGVRASAIAFSPDGKLLAYSRDSAPEIVLLDIASRKSVATFQGHKGHVYSLDFSPDSTRLVSSSGDTTAIIWRVPGRRSE